MSYCVYDKNKSTSEEYINAFSQYILTNHMDQLEEIVSDDDTEIHYSLRVNVLSLLNVSVRLGSILLSCSQVLISAR